jgi:hypothetical protein
MGYEMPDRLVKLGVRLEEIDLVLERIAAKLKLVGQPSHGSIQAYLDGDPGPLESTTESLKKMAATLDQRTRETHGESPGERKARLRKNLVDRIRELQERLYDLDREG